MRCGHRVMIQAVMRDLVRMGIPHERIIISLESHVNCGVGYCAQCSRGEYVSERQALSFRSKKSNKIRPGIDACTDTVVKHHNHLMNN